MPRTPSNQTEGFARKSQRNAARYQTTSLPGFNFGEVLDLSATGMRLRRPGKPIVAEGAVEKFVLALGAEPLTLLGRVVWVRRPSWLARFHDAGVQFLNVDKATSDRLVHIGQFGFDPGSSADPQDRARRKLLASIEVENLYPILGVSPRASEDEIGRAYRALVRRWHPDVCKADDASEQLARLSKAYKILRDRELRAKYDEMLAIAASPGPARERAA